MKICGICEIKAHRFHRFPQKKIGKAKTPELLAQMGTASFFAFSEILNIDTFQMQKRYNGQLVPIVGETEILLLLRK